MTTGLIHTAILDTPYPSFYIHDAFESVFDVPNIRYKNPKKE